MEPYKIKISAELNLENTISESREVAQAFNELADTLERIEKKYAESQEESEKNDSIKTVTNAEEAKEYQVRPKRG